MPNILDVFAADGFSTSELTTAINKLPYVPSRLASVFPFKGIITTTVQLERSKGKISLIPAKTRGAGGTSVLPATKRDLIPFNVVHLPHGGSLLADDLMGVRAFGTDSTLQTISTMTNEVMQRLRNDQEVTQEYHRIGAIQGIVLDADGSTPLIDLFDGFNITRQQVSFDFSDPLEEIKKACTSVRRLIEDNLGAVSFTGIVAQVGNGFWDALINHEEVKAAYDRWQDGEFARRDQRAGQAIPQFMFADIMFENYRGKVGAVPFVPDNEAEFYPTGIPDLFTHFGAPADYIETVSTLGKQVYVKQERMPMDRGIVFESQSNPAMLCSRPEVLIQGVGILPS